MDVSSVDTGVGIGAARAGRDVYGSRAIGDAEVTLRRHCAGLLMMAAYHLEILTATERIIEVHGTATSDHEDMAHAAGGEGLSDVISNAKKHFEKEARIEYE